MSQTSSDPKDERPYYNTYEGVAKSILTLEGFEKLREDRQVAHYTRKEDLTDFMVFGRYQLDRCGNCSPYVEHSGYIIPKNAFPHIPDVLTNEMFKAFLQTESPDYSWATSMNPGIPRHDLTCSYCGRGWDITNFFDAICRHDHKTIPLEDHVGKTLGDVKAIFEARTDAVYLMQDDILIRNDRFIDLSLKYPDTTNDWEIGIVKNEKGWVSSRDGIDDNYVIQSGDEGFFNVFAYLHKACNRQDIDQKAYTSFSELFEKAGFTGVTLTAIPNEYYPSDTSSPWFIADIEGLGQIKIGWRKRVININWSWLKDYMLSREEIANLFVEESVTKLDDYAGIHAWGYEKAEEYLRKIREHLVG